MRSLLFLFLLSFSVFAQHTKYSIKGKVLDQTTNQPIEYATITLLNSTDSTFVGGVVTDSSGKFLLPVPKLGSYLIKSIYIGYKRSFRLVEISDDQSNVILPDILLKDNSTSTNEVVVEGEKDFVQNTIEKQIYNVDKLGTTKGGTAVDVLQNIPSVTMDQDGSPSMRGTSVIVLIDGRPSGLSGQSRSAILDQIPASSIDRIEVVSNPSARYDPDGMSGIINVVLKKNAKPGYNGNAALTVGDRDKYNFNLNFNYKRNKLNWFANYSFNHGRYYGNGGSDRKVTFPTDTLYYIRQGQNNDNISDVHLIKTGIDYALTDKSNYSTSVTFNSKNQKLVNEVFDNTRLDSNKVITSYFDRTTNRTSKSAAFEWANNYIYNFAKKGSFISADANMSYNQDDILYDIYQAPSVTINSLMANGDTAYKSQMPEKGANYLLLFQSDYSYPINDQNRIDAGVKTTVRNIDREFVVKDFNFNTGSFFKNEQQSNRFAYDENIYSVYGIYNGKKGKWGYQAGARAEQTYTVSDQKTSGDKYRNDYFNIFPSAYLTFKPVVKSEWKATYSRRIVRPDIQNLNPFINYADRFTLRQGNPRLNPEYVNSYEFGHILTLKTMSFATTGYYRNSKDLIWRYRNALPEGVTVVSFQNISGSETKGLEVIHNWQIVKWWSLNSSVNLFTRQIFVGDLATSQTRKTESWNLKLLSNFKPFAGTNFSVSYTYDSPIATPQGIIKSFQGLDVSGSRDILKKRANIGIRFSDIFNTRQFRLEMDTPQFTDTFFRKRESRNVFVTFTWKFGSSENAGKKSEKKKGLNTEAQSEDGG